MTITSDQDFANDLVADFKAGITTPQAIPTRFPNAPLTPAKGVAHLIYDLVTGSQEGIEFGSPGQNTEEMVGHLAIRIFAPIETGAARSLELRDLIKDRYRDVTRAGADFRTPYTLSEFRQDDWWVTTVLCPFKADRFV